MLQGKNKLRNELILRYNFTGVQMDKKIDLSTKEIADKLFADEVTIEFVGMIRTDTRKSVQRLVNRYDKLLKEKKRVQDLYSYEYELQKQGIKYIAGVDEAGRGPLAGPVIAAAVILPLGCFIEKLNDSKKLSPVSREQVYKEVMDKAIAVNMSFIDEKIIDRINIYQASMNAMYNAIYGLSTRPEEVLIDAMPLDDLDIPHLSIVKGDAKSASIAAASIVAKVERDHLMDEYDKEYPVYGFAKHKGYGTKEHIKALNEYGPCPLHRRSFEPIKSMCKNLRGESSCPYSKE